MIRLQFGQKCSSTGAPAPQVRHSSDEMSRTGMDSGVMESACPLPARSRAEGAAAAAGLLRVRVVEHESACQQCRVVVERRPLEEHVALPVHEDLGAVAFEYLV